MRLLFLNWLLSCGLTTPWRNSSWSFPLPFHIWGLSVRVLLFFPSSFLLMDFTYCRFCGHWLSTLCLSALSYKGLIFELGFLFLNCLLSCELALWRNLNWSFLLLFPIFVDWVLLSFQSSFCFLSFTNLKFLSILDLLKLRL